MASHGRAAEKGTLQSYIGTVAEIITVDQDLETAIGAALGKNIQAIFLKKYENSISYHTYCRARTYRSRDVLMV